jgi:hypothetical protein
MEVLLLLLFLLLLLLSGHFFLRFVRMLLLSSCLVCKENGVWIVYLFFCFFGEIGNRAGRSVGLDFSLDAHCEGE